MSLDVNDLIKTIYQRQDVILEKISNIDVTLAKQHESLQFHIYRTNLNEEQIRQLQQHQDEVIKRLEQSLKEAIEKLDNRVKPIETHVAYLNGALKLFGVISIIAGGLVGLHKLLTLL